MTTRFAKYDKRFLGILFWETLENAPVLIGFLLAIRIQSENLALAFACLVVGAASGAGLIHFTEVKKFSNQPSLKETLTNFVAFTAVTCPFVFYFSANGVWWSNWLTDIVLGMAAGITLAVAESWGWENKASVKGHAVSMAILAALFLFCARLIYKIEAPVSMLAAGIIFTIVISIIIVQLDYWPIKGPDRIPESK